MARFLLKDGKNVGAEISPHPRLVKAFGREITVEIHFCAGQEYHTPEVTPARKVLKEAIKILRTQLEEVIKLGS